MAEGVIRGQGKKAEPVTKNEQGKKSLSPYGITTKNSDKNT